SDYLNTITSVQENLKENLEKANERYKIAADRLRLEPRISRLATLSGSIQPIFDLHGDKKAI
ncbi:hypothetical protein H4Q26_017884, partial [Puccinia striiformis f. sp. tritici PST-130]